MSSRIVWGFLAGFVVGALAAYAWVGRDARRFERERDAALASDSARKDTIAAMRVREAVVMRTVDSILAELSIAHDEIDSLIARGPRVVRVVRVDTVGDTSTFDAVPLGDYRRLEASCARATSLCVQAKDSLLRLLALSDSIGRAEGARADSLAKDVEGFTPVRDPPRLTLGLTGGYGLVLANGGACHGPGAAAGLSYGVNFEEVIPWLGRKLLPGR